MFGRLNRMFTLSGYSASEFCTLLWGNRKVSIHPYLTVGLADLEHLTSENKEKLLHDTLFPIFMYFNPSRASTLMNFCMSGNASQAFRYTQLPSYKLGSLLILKYCSMCAEDDVYRFGLAYWRTFHQVPGISACCIHSTKLKWIPLDRRNRFSRDLIPIPKADIEPCSATELKVSIFALRIIRALKDNKQLPTLAHAYRERLVELELVTQNGSVRRKQLNDVLRESFESFSQPFDCNRPLELEAENAFVNRRLLQRPTGHPLQHLILLTSIFDSVDDFLLYRCQQVTQKNTYKGSEAKLETRELCTKLLKSGTSLNAISKKTGKSRCYLKTLASLEKIPINRFPRVVTEEMTQAVILLAKKGFHRDYIAKETRLSVGTVEQIISQTSGLALLRKAIHKQSLKRKYRLKLLRQLRSDDALSRSALIRKLNKECHWLYRNDNEWLNLTLPSPIQPCPIGKVRRK